MRGKTWVLVVLLAAGAVRCSDGAPETTLDGIYTPEQAQRGEALYGQHCARCHSRQEFAGRLFTTVWSGQPLFALYDRIATTMPMDQPGSLGSSQAAALTAHILALNAMPPGDSDISADRDWLSSIRIQLPD